MRCCPSTSCPRLLHLCVRQPVAFVSRVSACRRPASMRQAVPMAEVKWSGVLAPLNVLSDKEAARRSFVHDGGVLEHFPFPLPVRWNDVMHADDADAIESAGLLTRAWIQRSVRTEPMAARSAAVCAAVNSKASMSARSSRRPRSGRTTLTAWRLRYTRGGSRSRCRDETCPHPAAAVSVDQCRCVDAVRSSAGYATACRRPSRASVRARPARRRRVARRPVRLTWLRAVPPAPP